MAALSDEFAEEMERLRARFLLRVEHEMYSSDNFGNAHLLLTGEGMSVQLVRDRGQVFFDVRLLNSDWEPVDVLLARIQAHPRPGASLSLQEAIAALCAAAGLP